ncbi:hypothetical protein [Sinanaerobacter chloroacetimidivorans]|uniref:Uncharacterized protein n=1 Tax=Sinanaerobacter chloroacetimidivorans TaxID=2818044 RepID=A0A8J7VXN7_9FIRM|nr:hypothetical protein [Sinanaerobacter chloroacetimidivorans]MBR0596601.1 hypothetical protein [Sinanaerobacter chloroacetimidivorans]
MSLDYEAKKTFFDEKTAEKQIIEEFTEGAAGEIPAPEPAGILRLDFGFLLKKTGPNTVEYYLDHPMNAKRSKGFARQLRGFTGIAGDLDLAIIDIVLGGIEVFMERRGNNGAD